MRRFPPVFPIQVPRRCEFSGARMALQQIQLGCQQTPQQGQKSERQSVPATIGLVTGGHILPKLA